MSTAVYFNLDGTLTRNDHDFAGIYQQAVSNADLGALAEDYEEYTDKFFNYFQDGWAYPRRQAMLNLMRDRQMPDLGHTDAFGEAWAEAEAAETTLHTGARDMLAALHEAYQLGIVTNGTGALQRRKLEQDSVRDMFDSIVISSEIGVVKPHVDFFETAKQYLDADTYIVVSHDLRRDILPAKRAGYKTVWLGEANDPKLDAVVDAQAATLAEVPAAVEKLAE